MSFLWTGRYVELILFLTSHTTLPYLHICFTVSESIIEGEDDAHKSRRAFYLEQLVASFNLDNPSKPSDCIDATIRLTHRTIVLKEEEANRHEDNLRALKSASEELHGQILDMYISMIFFKGQPKQAPASLNAESNGGSQSILVVQTDDLSLSRATGRTIINEVSVYSKPWKWPKSLLSGSSS